MLSEYVEGWWVQTRNKGAGGEIIIGVLVSYETRTIMEDSFDEEIGSL